MTAVLERIERPSYLDFRRHFLCRGKPVVITGAFDDWPAMQRWTLDYIEQAVGNRRIAPVITANGTFHLDLRDGVRVEEMDFPAYRAHIEGQDAPPYYLRLPLEG